MREISASVLGADLMRLGEEIRMVEKLGVNWLHVDNMDGDFVPNISYGPDFVASMRKFTNLFLDVHLMLQHPMQYIPAFAKAGSDLITIHYEAADDPEAALREVAAQGVKTGLSINPGTDPEKIRHLLPLCDLVLVMTVQPGFGGQSMREDCLAKLPVLREMIRETGREILLEVDGGIKESNAHMAIEAGADVLVIGTGLFRAEDPAQVVRSVMKAAEGK